jgi:hypothetical protein
MTYTIRMNVELTHDAIEDIIDGAGMAIGYWATKGVVDEEAQTYVVTDGEDGKEYIIHYSDIARAIQLIVDGDADVRDDIKESITLDLLDYDNAYRMDSEAYDRTVKEQHNGNQSKPQGSSSPHRV